MKKKDNFIKNIKNRAFCYTENGIVINAGNEIEAEIEFKKLNKEKNKLKK